MLCTGIAVMNDIHYGVAMVSGRCCPRAHMLIFNPHLGIVTVWVFISEAFGCWSELYKAIRVFPCLNTRTSIRRGQEVTRGDSSTCPSCFLPFDTHHHLGTLKTKKCDYICFPDFGTDLLIPFWLLLLLLLFV